jgi:16S rRNA (cytidine1402-2'-O)-methyltransferase
MSKLSVVATPIGNLEDITLRALRILTEAHVIFCEDTRVTKKLLAHHDIHTRTIRCDAHKEGICAQKVIEYLTAGQHVVYVTDAGTPGISDPGAYLVSVVRAALPEVSIEAIPGASSLTAALSISGIAKHSFRFLGFFPHKKGRETLFKAIALSNEPVVFYESTHRIVKTLEGLSKHMPEKQVVLARELTKKFEEVISGSPEELRQLLAEDAVRQKGEFVVLVV